MATMRYPQQRTGSSLIRLIAGTVSEARRHRRRFLARKTALRRFGAPRRRQQRHIIRAPLADRLRASALEGVFDRLGLTDGDVQAEQRCGDRKRPFVQTRLADWPK